jgi:hypothetical protein
MMAHPVVGVTQPEAKVPDRLAEAGVAEGQNYVMRRPPGAQGGVKIGALAFESGFGGDGDGVNGWETPAGRAADAGGAGLAFLLSRRRPLCADLARVAWE